MAKAPRIVYAAPPMAARFPALIVATALILLVACSPEIGDPCSTSIDCSANGDRICDLAAPGGYCSLQECAADACPDEAVCVEFLPEPARLATAWCMASCEVNDDCRAADGYHCARASEISAEDGTVLATVLDRAGDRARFCVSVEP